ncbi:hypothetical protein [Streptomyces sp. NPDC003635]
MSETLEITMPVALRDRAGPQALWDLLRARVGHGEGDVPDLMALHLNEPELRALDWEDLVHRTTATPEDSPPRVVRTAVGPSGFHESNQLSFGDLPVRVLVVGVDSHVDRGAADDPLWHEDVAVHDAVHTHAERWEVDVLPGAVSQKALAEAITVSKPHVLHLAGDTARSLYEEGAHALGGLNLCDVRLVISSNHEPRAQAHRLLEPYVQADALTPALAVVSLTPEPRPEPEHALCKSLTELYGRLMDGHSVDVAARAVTEAEDASVSAAVTVNCRPELVLPSAPEPPSEVPELYESLKRATDRVGQRLTALEKLESGTAARQLIVLSGGDEDDKIGTTWFLLSLMRVWEQRPGCRALYLDFARLGSIRPPRSAGQSPRADDVVLDTAALLAESVRTQSERHGGWGLDERVDAVRRLLSRDGGYHTRISTVRGELVKAAIDLLVKAAPADTHLVLALDHFLENEEVRPSAEFLVKHLFKPVLHSRSSITVVVTAKRPHQPQTADRLAEFVAERQHITLQRWSAHHGWPLLRELGTRMGYDWHDKPEWRALVREKLDTLEEDFGPKFLKDVCDTALTRIG